MGEKREISLQPKQWELLKLIEESRATVIGVGGGRGAAKSSGADRCAVTLMYERNGMTVCMVMRTWVKQMIPFHLEAIRRDFPWLAKDLISSAPGRLKIRDSRMEFKYAENYDAVEEAFRSGNYDLIFIDQAEQFSWREIVEIRKAARTKGGKAAKVVLLFNMRGACIQDLRKVFYLHDVAHPEDYVFLKVNPWDNVEWVREALASDGYTDREYYGWTDGQRKSYAAERGPYTRQLASDDPVISKADWEGSWDSIEGAYFSSSFDLGAVQKSPAQLSELVKPWATRWMSQDYGRTHYTSHHWHWRLTIPPEVVSSKLGWVGRKTPLNLTVTYRELVVNEMTGTEVGRKVAQMTPEAERPSVRAFFLSPELVTGEPHTIGAQEAAELRGFGLPGPKKADNERIGGWGLMAQLLKASRQKGVDDMGREFEDAWLISSDCVELIRAIPMAMRDPKNLDDVLKTDKSSARVEQDVLDDVRYGLKSMLRPRAPSREQAYQERMTAATPASRMMEAFRHAARRKKKTLPVQPPSWRANL